MSTEKTSLENENQPSCLGDVSGWQFCKDKLPQEQFAKNGVWDNEQLLLVKWDKHDSLELAVLTRVNGILVWEIPNFSTVNLSEVSQWMRIPACR